MLKTRILLGAALTLSVTALVSTLLKPRVAVPKPGLVEVTRQGPLTVEARTSHTATHVNGGELFAELSVTLDEEAPKEVLPVSMVLVLDRSGSMNGGKMEGAKRAAHQLVDLLGERDELGLVSFASDVEVQERRRMTPEGKAALHAAIDVLQPSGSTFISGGLEAGERLLRGAAGAQRLVLVSDGRPTAGLATEPELVHLVGRLHDEAVTVTALGVGSDYDGLLMQHLAERGGGMYGYLEDASALETVLAKEVAAARTAAVRNVVVSLEGQSLVIEEAPGRHLTRTSRGALLHLADLQPRQPTRLFVRLRALRGEEGDVGRLLATVRWRSLLEATTQEASVSVGVVRIDDEDAVLASKDEAVYSRGIEAVGSLKLVAAAAAYERGDVSAASFLLGDARKLFGMSANALAGQAEVDRVRHDFEKADAHGRGKLARGLEKKTMSNFGREHEGY